MKLSPERQQKVDTLLKELNTLNTRYEQKGFKFEAFQPYDFDELIQVVIENDKYQLKSNIRANMRLLTEETKKLMDCFFDLPLKLYTFNQFIISFQHEGFEIQKHCTLIIDSKSQNIRIEFRIPTNNNSIKVTFRFNNQLAFIDHVYVFSMLTQDCDTYQTTIPGTTIQLSVDISSNTYNEIYVKDEKDFPYGSSNVLISAFITTFMNISKQLNLARK